MNVKWQTLTIPEKSAVPDSDDIEILYFAIVPVESKVNLVVINGEQFEEQIDRLLEQSQIIEWNVDKVLLNRERSEWLRWQEGWPAGMTYWALFDKSGMLAHGPRLPSLTEIHQALQESRVEKWPDALRRFIREHPDNMDAKLSFHNELKRIAERKTKEKIGDMAGWDASLTLAEEDDEAIWGEFASCLNHLSPHLEHGLPFVVKYGFWDSDYFMHSQKMKDAARAILPKVESSLGRLPNNGHLWQIWSVLSDLEGRRRFKDLKETLVLSPTADPRQFPDVWARGHLVRRYRSRSNWQAIVDVLESSWEELQNRPARAGEWDWPDNLNYLFEAYLRLGKENEANALLMHWEQSQAWGTVMPRAIGMAEKCGKGALAERWKKLNPE